MSLTTIMSTASSGLMAAQAGMRTVSDNIANANTPGYVRKVVNQSSLVSMGAGAGVNIEGVARVVDRYLQTASLAASSTAGKAGVTSELMDRAQSLFGDPSGDTNFFMDLGDVFADFAALANDPTSSLSRGQALTSLQAFFDNANRIGNSLAAVQAEADTRIKSDVTRANDLLAQITKLNFDIRKANIAGTDASGAENIQSQLVDELSGLINVQIQVDPNGGTVLRTEDGQLLADDTTATLSFVQTADAAGYLTIKPGGSNQTFDAIFSSGELVGLLQARNNDIPGALAQLAEYTAGAARELNRAHNDASAVPAPQTLSGRNTGLDVVTASQGFSGKTTIALMNAAGVVQNRIDIDFTAGQITLNAGAPAAFTSANFVSVLNGVMTGVGGGATFNNGALTLNAGAGATVAVQDDAVTPARRGGQGFSQFFGLNDLVRSTSLPMDTGLAAGDNHGFTAGQTVTFRLTDASGVRIRDVNFSIPAGATMGNLVTGLQNAVAPYGTFNLSPEGRLSFSSSASPQATLSVVQDLTSRGAGGPSLTSFFGLGIGGKAQLGSSFSIDSKIYQNPSLLSAAKLDLTVAAGKPSLAAGDGRGALAMATAGEQTSTFGVAGNLPAGSMTLSRYATEVAGSLGRRAAAAETAKKGAEAVKAEADSRRTSYEGVNTDEELIKLTTYQQAFNAAARMIQATNDLYDALLSMVG